MATRAIYSEDDDRTLIKTLVDEARAGHQSENGWKKCVWVACTAALAGSEKKSGGKAKGPTSCKDHFQTLKRDYFIVKELSELSGFGWDSVEKCVTAPDDVWEKYLEAHPEAKKWKTKSFPLFDEIGDLVDGRRATGEGAFHPGRDADPTSDVEERAESPEKTPEPEEAAPPSAPSTPVRKRAASSAPVSSRATTKKKNNGRVSAVDKADEMVNALHRVVDVLADSGESSSGLASSPVRRMEAIKALTKDSTLTADRKVKLIRLFQKQTTVADSYLTLLGDDELRSGYVAAELDALDAPVFD